MVITDKLATGFEFYPSLLGWLRYQGLLKGFHV